MAKKPQSIATGSKGNEAFGAKKPGKPSGKKK